MDLFHGFLLFAIGTTLTVLGMGTILYMTKTKSDKKEITEVEKSLNELYLKRKKKTLW
jgi:hypothetical protein|tara:strand:+ start:389 stop:562 length:174 start_codon:yes stop_codon:yes gene_type:complete